MSDRARALWARTRVLVWPERYLLASIPPARAQEAAALFVRAGETFAALVRERDEVSLTVPEAWRAEVEALGSRVAGPYRVLTFDLELRVGRDRLPGPGRPSGLAAAGVSIVRSAAIGTDHLLVWERDLETAVGTLETLIRESRS